MEKNSMLYIMGIDWEWIYQRPQIFAEKLAGDYDVTVLFPRSILQAFRKKPVVEGLKFKVLWTLPYQEKNRLLYALSRLLNRRTLKETGRYDYAFVGYPLYARYLPENFGGRIIYDCMDNHEALYPDRKRVDRILEQERKLVERCDLLLASSTLLKEKMDALRGEEISVLVRNGVKNGEIYPMAAPAKKEEYTLCYIGTISEWFDMELVKGSLQALPGISYRLIGPCHRKTELPGVDFTGPVPHGKLAETIEDCDCLVMPFVVNEIVAGVDPVKLYEYIAFGKCIVSVGYPEIERFEPYVYFYHTPEEYVELLRTLREKGFPPKYDEAMQRAFLTENTWQVRASLLKEKIDDIR